MTDPWKEGKDGKVDEERNIIVFRGELSFYPDKLYP